jgi:hypothetical protein
MAEYILNSLPEWVRLVNASAGEVQKKLIVTQEIKLRIIAMQQHAVDGGR